MECPYCTKAFHDAWQPGFSVAAERGMYGAMHQTCPSCGRLVINLTSQHPGIGRMGSTAARIIWPQHATRPVAPEVDQRYATDFEEACGTITISPKASAALSRRLLQDILREKAGITRRNLDEEIRAAVESGSVPTWLSENLDAVRAVGNFAAHPIKSTNTGEVVEIEPGEAELLLNVVEGLFDFYFVQPAKAKAARDAINAKLAEANKPPLK